MMLNRKMLYTIADIIEENNDFWDQDEWMNTEDIGYEEPNAVIYNGNEYVCGTTQCVAGWAVLIEHGGLDASRTSEHHWFMKDGFSTDDWAKSGAEILGLSEVDSLNLFYTTDIANPYAFDMPRVLRDIADGASVGDAIRKAAERCDYELSSPVLRNDPMTW
jgi:hypothetical protein